MSKSPPLTVSVVTWNSEKYISSCLQSIGRQTLEGIEVIVVDNHSSDHTLSLVNAYAGPVRVIANNENLGYSGGHNCAIRASTAPYVCCINPDVELDPEYFRVLLSVLESDETLGGAIGKVYSWGMESGHPPGAPDMPIDTCGLTLRRNRQFVARNHGEKDTGTFSVTTPVFGVDGMVSVYRRSMLLDVAYAGESFDESFFAYCEDQDLCWRARILGWRFVHVPSAIAYHDRHWVPHSRKERKRVSALNRRNALRNHYLMVIKNDFVALALLHFPFIAVRAAAVLVYIMLFERETLAAYPLIVKGIPEILRKRRWTMDRRKISVREFLRLIGT